MNRPRLLHWALIAGALASSQSTHAHAPVLDCFVKQGKVTCEAGFSDGSSAAGRKIQVLDASNKVLLDGVLDKAGLYTFTAPAVDYHVVFYGGEHHQVTLHSANIKE
jgi:formylmethanofuran dehydrogenase subunit A